MHDSGLGRRAWDWGDKERCGPTSVRLAEPSHGHEYGNACERASCLQVRQTARVLSSLDVASVCLTLADRLEPPVYRFYLFKALFL